MHTMSEESVAVELQQVVVVESETPTEEELAIYPWKYVGYPGFTSQIAADPDFFAVRRFDRLHTRVILTLQAHLSELEEKLDSLDRKLSARSARLRTVGVTVAEVVDVNTINDSKCDDLEEINNGSVRFDLPERAELVSAIARKVAEYDQALINYSSIHSMGRAPARNIKNIRNWFHNHPGAIMSQEAHFISHRHELIAASQPKAPLRRGFEDYFLFTTRKCLGLFRKKPHSSLMSHMHADTYITQDSAVNIFTCITIFATASTMLVAPLWILQTLQDMKTKLAVITVFVLLALAFLSMALLGRPLARWGATAGYAAVLVVFLQVGTTT